MEEDKFEVKITDDFGQNAKPGAFDINDVLLMSTDVEEVKVPDVIEMPSGDIRQL